MSSLSTKPTKFLGSFVTNNPYRGKPGPKVDMAWMKWHEFRKLSENYTRCGLTGTALLRVTEDDVKKSFGYETDPEYRSTVIEMEGGGKLATIELFHQMHCLVSLLFRGCLNPANPRRTWYGWRHTTTTTRTRESTVTRPTISVKLTQVGYDSAAFLLRKAMLTRQTTASRSSVKSSCATATLASFPTTVSLDPIFFYFSL